MLVVPVKAHAQSSVRYSPGVPTSSPVSTEIDPPRWSATGSWPTSSASARWTDFGASVDDMECDFGADGQAHVTLAIEQDRDTMDRERSFRFVTADSRIVADRGPMVAYEVMGRGRPPPDDGPTASWVHLHRTAD